MNHAALCSTLTHSLIKVLEAPPPKARTPVEEDPEEEPEDHGERGVRLCVWGEGVRAYVCVCVWGGGGGRGG